jgi:uncharacterized membrane protein
VVKEDREEYSIDITSFLVKLKQGGSKTQVLEITNTGTKKLNFSLSVEGLEEYIYLSSDFFSLDSGQSKTILIDFKVPVMLLRGIL